MPHFRNKFGKIEQLRSFRVRFLALKSASLIRGYHKNKEMCRFQQNLRKKGTAMIFKDFSVSKNLSLKKWYEKIRIKK